MRFTDYITTAFGNLFRQKLRTFLTVFAIVIGALSVTIMLSLVLAGKKAFIGSLEASGALKLVTVMPSSETDDNNDNLFGTSWNSDSKHKLDDTTIAKLQMVNHVEAITPVMSAQGVRNVQLEGQTKKFSANMIGVDFSKNVFNTDVVAGRSITNGDFGKIVISDSMLGDFGYKGKAKDIIGKKILFISKGMGGVPVWAADPPQQPMNGSVSDGDAYWKSLQEKEYTLPVEIIGVMGSGVASDNSLITLDFARYLSKSKMWGITKEDSEAFDKAQKEFQVKQTEFDKQNRALQNTKPKPGQPMPQPLQPPQAPKYPEQKIIEQDNFDQSGYGSIMLKVDETSNVETVAADVQKLTLKTVTAQKMIDDFMNIFKVIGVILGGIGCVSLFVAAIGIINTMVMATYERTKEIGVLRACGAKRGTIRLLFTFEAALLGFLGGLVGLGVSYGLAKIGNIVLDKVAVQQSLPLNNLITFPLWLWLGVIGFTTLIGMLAGVYPAIRASRLNPIVALRYE